MANTQDTGPMTDDQFDALCTAAARDGGIDFDGLRVTQTDDGYVFATPDVEQRGLSVEDLRQAAADDDGYVSNWYYWTQVLDMDTADAEQSSRSAFLRWLEHAGDQAVPERYEQLAGGIQREWGELQITATVTEDGLRRYHLRHVDDAGADLAELDTHDDPLDARTIAKLDERQRYRPLKTAPTLRTGWAFTDLDGRDLVTAVDNFYPATIANWHREREGDLDVSHWDETAARQTGIYDIIDELDAEAVDWIAESCCVDSQCLKRREWEKNEETDLAPDAGDGVFPCREPCSLVVAAARKWTQLEREEERTYEFELTPSEKEQVEAIIDAVAEGRTDEIREADIYDDANRYRARFLRAKRFDDAGNLSGTPTEE